MDLPALFREFRSSWVDTEAGRHHQILTLEGRRQGRANYEAIRAARGSGEDVTEAVLLKLLPYSDTSRTRELDAWRVICPVFRVHAGDWLAGNDWVKREDQPQAAIAILDWIDRCLHAPGELAHHCRWFAELPFITGLQSGSLSPILNALAPDHFMVVNKKPLRLLQALTGRRWKARIEFYAEANRRLRELVEEHRPLLQVMCREGDRPDDVFDMFCHWFVAERPKLQDAQVGPAETGLEAWKIAPGARGAAWEEMRAGGYIGLGWKHVGDLSEMEPEEVAARWSEVAEQRPGYGAGGLKMLQAFEAIPVGSTVVANRGTDTVLGIGEVTGAYRFFDGEDFPHRLPVRWLDTSARAVDKPGWRRTMVRLDAEELVELRGGVSGQGEVESVSAAPLFSPRTFELLGAIAESPVVETYEPLKNELEREVVAGVKTLLIGMRDVVPESLKELVETEKRLFSQFRKNDHGRGGAWPYYWGAFYPKGGRRRDQAQLAVFLTSTRHQMGFALANPQWQARLLGRLEGLRAELLDRMVEEMVAAELDVSEFEAEGAGPAVSRETLMERVGSPLGVRVMRTFDPQAVVEMPRAAHFDACRRAFLAALPLWVMATADDDEWSSLVDGLLGEVEAGDDGEVQPAYSLDAFEADTGLGVARLEAMVAALRRKKQVILQGPPGTGKTHVAQRLARHVVQGGRGFCEVLQFHSAYGYEDFIQGLRPEVESGQIRFRMRKGHFLRVCEAARRAHPDPCVLVIDEINRADLSRVLGELMYLLEYRDEEVRLAQGERPFRIPDNLFLVGTMNTADRSVTRLDHAMRRRFAFLRLEPEFEVLDARWAELGLPAEGIIATMTRINDAIGDADFALGISYFLGDGIAEHLEAIWRAEVEPYLEEYFLDQPDRMREFRWARVKGDLQRDWDIEEVE